MLHRLFLSFFLWFFVSPIALSTELSGDEVMREALNLGFHDPHLLLAIALVESDLRPSVTNEAGGTKYYGLMQICYDTARFVGFRGQERNLYDWRTNLKYASKYLSYLFLRYNFNKDLAIAAYNAGTAYHKNGQLINQRYVDKVNSNYLKVRQVYGAYKRRYPTFG